MDKKKRILVVDDEEVILKVFKEILQSRGFSVDTAETGREALEKSKMHYYNLALLDIKLPDIDGTELLIEMHRNTPKMMKVMVTGYPSLKNAVKSLKLGADEYIMKPVAPEELIRIVEEKLQEQEDAENMTEQKVKEWVETRIKRLENSRES